MVQNIRGPEASEYGGVPGRIQPPPHDVANSPHEQLSLIYSTDPADPEDGIDAALNRELNR